MNPRIKAWPTGRQDEIRARIARHRDLDEIIQNVGWDGAKGCAIGCSLDRYDWQEYSDTLGVDLRTAALVDRLHERQTPQASRQWPGRVANALQPGADTTLVADRFLHWLLDSFGPVEHCTTAVELYRRRCAGDEPDDQEWKRAACEALAAHAHDALAARAAHHAALAAHAHDALAACEALAAHALAALAARAAHDVHASADQLIRIIDDPTPYYAEGH